MTSIFENTHSKVTVHILHDDTLTDDNRRKFLRTAEKYSQGIELHDVNRLKDALNSDRIAYARNRYSIGSLFRLLVPDILPQIEKVIYIDCDVICDMDILEMWSINMEGKTLAGAIDMPGLSFNNSFYAQKMRLLLNGCRPETYINAGVLLMNLNRIRERGNLLTIAADWLAKRGKMALAADQDALNAIFVGDIKVIDSRFNQNVLVQDMSGRIIHMLFGKPWKNIQGIYSDRLYWKMYLRSAWGENTTRDEIIDIIANVVAGNVHVKPRQNVLRRIISAINRRTIARIIPFTALRYIRLDIAARIRHIFKRS